MEVEDTEVLQGFLEAAWGPVLQLLLMLGEEQTYTKIRVVYIDREQGGVPICRYKTEQGVSHTVLSREITQHS